MKYKNEFDHISVEAMFISFLWGFHFLVHSFINLWYPILSLRFSNSSVTCLYVSEFSAALFKSSSISHLITLGLLSLNLETMFEEFTK